jgi:hypothetical protein
VAALDDRIAHDDLSASDTIYVAAMPMWMPLHARRVATESLGRVLDRVGVEPAAQLTATRELARPGATRAVAARTARRLLHDPRLQPDQLVDAAGIILDTDPGDPGAAEALWAQLVDAHAPIKVRVHAALTYAGTCPDACDRLNRHLSSILDHADPPERIVGAIALVRIQLPQPGDATKVLHAVATDARMDPDIRWHAAHELTTIHHCRHVGAQALQAIIDVDDLSVADRCRLATAMAELGPAARDHAAAVLARILADPALTSTQRRMTAVAMAGLSPVYRDLGAAQLLPDLLQHHVRKLQPPQHFH